MCHVMKHLLTPCKVLFVFSRSCGAAQACQIGAFSSDANSAVIGAMHCVVLYARYACKLQLLHHLDTVESVDVKPVKHCKYLLAQLRLSKCRQTGEGQSAVGSQIPLASKYELGVPL